MQVLIECTDRYDNPLMIWPKHQGGLGELRNHVRYQDSIREKEKKYYTVKKQGEEEDG